MVELYETSFSPADVPYAASSGTPSHAELRKGIANELDRVAALRGEPTALVARVLCYSASASAGRRGMGSVEAG